MSETPPEEWRWYGHPGHLIVGRWCRFHLCTEIGPVLVSTVGQFVHPRHSGGSERAEAEWLREHPDGEEIGLGRFYETMVFRTTGERCAVEGCACGLPGIIPEEVECEGYQTAGEATKGHLAVCERWAAERGRTPEEVAL